MNEFWDKLGISTSILCILHCLLTPLLVIAVPFVGHALHHQPWIHYLIILIAFPVAIWALWNGYRLHHRKQILVIGSIGLTLMSAAVFFVGHNSRIEIILMIAAGLCLAAAHYFNLRVCRKVHR